MQRLLITAAAIASLMAFPAAASAGDPAPTPADRSLVGLLNDERETQGMPAVEISPALTDISHDYGAENAARGGITHDRDTPYTARANKAGCGYWKGPVMGEGYASPAAALQGWLASPAHRPVVLDPKNTHIGVSFNGPYVLAYVMRCTGKANSSGDFGNWAASSAPLVNSDLPSAGSGGALKLSSVQITGKGRAFSARVRAGTGKGTLRLTARSGKTTVQGKKVAATGRTGAYKLGLRVSRPGRWVVTVSVNGRVARRVTLTVPAPRR